MNPYFKKYLKDAAVGSGVLSVVGAACGAVAGIMGLRQMCFVDMNQSETCENQLYPLIVPYAQNAAAVVGATAGAAVGAVIGAVAYPSYQCFLGWCYHEAPQERRIVDVNSFVNNGVERLNV